MVYIERIDRPRNNLAPPRRGHLLTAVAFFLVVAVYGSLVPLEYKQLDWEEAVRRFQEIKYLELGVESRADWVANILLFVPLGFLGLGAVAADRKPAVAWAALLPLVALLGALSLALEFTQLWFPRRTVSQNDIFAEMIGAGIGAGMWLMTGQALVDWLRSFATNNQPGSRSHKLLQLYTLGLVIYSVLPLDLTIRLGELYDKYKQGRMVLVPLAYNYDSLPDLIYNLLVDALVFVPVGMLAVRGIFQELPARRSVIRAVATGGLLALGIELVQLIVYSRVSDVTDLVICTLGVGLGAWLVQYWQPGSSAVRRPVGQQIFKPRFALWAAVVVGYTLVVIAVFWFPFDFRVESDFAKPRLARFFEVPFKWMYRGSEFKAIREFLRKTLFFGGLGAVWVQLVWQLRVPPVIRRLFLAAGMVYCVALAIGIELGQVILPSHTPDFTDVLLCTLGAGLGIMLGNFVRSQQ